MHASDMEREAEFENSGSSKEKIAQVEDSNRLEKLDTIEIDNYHGITVKTILVYASINLIAFAQLLNLVGSGAFAHNIAAVVGGSDKSFWLSQAIVIATVALGPPVSQATDLWGRKWFLVILTACGAIGSIILSRATSMGMAIAGECICGLAYGSQPLLYAVVSEILPRKYRPAAQGGINASLAAGGITALLAGSVMIKDYTEGFRAFWYMVAAILALSAIVCAVLYNPPPLPLQVSLTNKEKLGRLDLVAYALLPTGTVLFVLALSWGDNPYKWTSANVLAPLFVGAALLFGLLGHQIKFKKDGLLHHGLFRGDRNFPIALFVMFVDGMAFFAANNYYAFEVSVLYETDPFRTGLRFCIVFFASIVSSLSIAAYSSVTKQVRAPIVVSFALFVVFFACMASAGTGSSTAVWVYPMILGLGIGFSLTCLVTIAQLSTPPKLIAITSGLLIAIRSFGGSIGLAIYTSIFNSALADLLGPRVAAAVVPLGLPVTSIAQFIAALSANDPAALMKVPGVTNEIIGAGAHALQVAFGLAFRRVWITAAVFSAVATIAACFFVEPKTITMHVDAPLEVDQS